MVDISTVVHHPQFAFIPEAVNRELFCDPSLSTRCPCVEDNLVRIFIIIVHICRVVILLIIIVTSLNIVQIWHCYCIAPSMSCGEGKTML